MNTVICISCDHVHQTDAKFKQLYNVKFKQLVILVIAPNDIENIFQSGFIILFEYSKLKSHTIRILSKKNQTKKTKKLIVNK